MLKSYLKQTWRSLTRNKSYSLLNIIGLSVGLTCFALIALWVSDEVSYDKFNRNYNRIVRLASTAKTETGISESALSSALAAKVLKNAYPEVENTVRMKMREEIVTHNNQQVLQSGILLADPSFFDVFTYPITRGDIVTALREPYSIILTESAAKKYFGGSDPMGQTLLINMYDSTGYGASYTVTGVMPDPPQNAHFTFNMLASFKTVEVADPSVLTAGGWNDVKFYTYLLLKKSVDFKTFSKKISRFHTRFVGDLSDKQQGNYSYALQPLTDIHLRSYLQHELAPAGSMSQVYIFSSIGIFILLLAGINYTNLATARSSAKAKEVGIKKVVGANKAQLVLHYLLESVLTALLALVLSFLCSFLLQPFFHQLTAKNLSLFSSPLLLLFLVVVTFFLGLAAGVYPAIVLSAFKPATVLKGAFKSSGRGILLRKTLVVAQFVITLVLITGIVVTNAQMAFIKHTNLGYNKEALLFLRVNGNTDVIKGYSAFKNEARSSSLISGMATSNSLIGGGLDEEGVETVTLDGRPLQGNMARLRVDADYFNVYGIRFSAGSGFNGTGSNSNIRQIILNETAIKKLGWKNSEAAIGKPFEIEGQQGTVVGVVKDFHFNSLRQSIEPLAIYPLENHFSRITLKVAGDKADQAIALVERIWKQNFPSALFDYGFLDKQLEAAYKAEERFSTMFLYFSVLSLLIACLGLYGLISYTASQRTKEIGIRKVLGATSKGIVALLSKDFIKLVLLACFIATPVAWFAMNNWLRNFAYRISISWWMFAVTAIAVLLVALLTVSVQAIKAAIANPVKNLRTE